MDSAKIYINGELLGYCKDPESFTNEMREKRRNGEVSHEMNITCLLYTSPSPRDCS